MNRARLIGTSSVALLLFTLLSSVGTAQTLRERIDNHFNNRLLDFQDVVERSQTSLVVMGRVTEIFTESYLQRNPYSEPEFTPHVGRVVKLEVEQSWKSSTSPTLVLMTHGGALPSADDPNAPWPTECHASNDIELADGEQVILALTVNNPYFAQPVWTYGGYSGKVSLDLACESFKPTDDQRGFDPDTLAYLEFKKVQFVEAVLHYLNTTWQEGGN